MDYNILKLTEYKDIKNQKTNKYIKKIIWKI